jgi:hypothetical protein
MRFFNAARAEAASEDSAVAIRLHAIVGRGQAELSLYAQAPGPSETIEPTVQAKRFWTPEEVAAENESDSGPEG